MADEFAVEVNHWRGKPELFEGLTKKQAVKLINDKAAELEAKGYATKRDTFYGMPEVTFANSSGDTGYIGVLGL